MSILSAALERLKEREFVSLATVDKKSCPHAAMKFLLKIHGKDVYFVDCNYGRTAENLKARPRLSFAFMDLDSLVGYTFIGSATVIEKGREYLECLFEFREKKMKLSVERIIKGIYSDKPQENFELLIPERFTLYKVRIRAVIEVLPTGESRMEAVRIK
jgi:uncharacterized pyridoxamine 5'-phosphate oxidase family protein